MTLREKFAKYTTEELETKNEKLFEKLRDSNKRMHDFRKARELEFYKEEKIYNENLFSTILDIDAVLVSRRKK